MMFQQTPDSGKFKHSGENNATYTQCWMADKGTGKTSINNLGLIVGATMIFCGVVIVLRECDITPDRDGKREKVVLLWTGLEGPANTDPGGTGLATPCREPYRCKEEWSLRATHDEMTVEEILKAANKQPAEDDDDKYSLSFGSPPKIVEVTNDHLIDQPKILLTRRKWLGIIDAFGNGEGLPDNETDALQMMSAYEPSCSGNSFHCDSPAPEINSILTAGGKCKNRLLCVDVNVDYDDCWVVSEVTWELQRADIKVDLDYNGNKFNTHAAPGGGYVPS